MTSQQLRLITTNPPEWKLDDETRRIGFEGIAKARETLRRRAAERIGAEKSDSSTDHDLVAA